MDDAAAKDKARRDRENERRNFSRKLKRRALTEAIEADKQAKKVSASQFEPRPPTEAELLLQSQLLLLEKRTKKNPTDADGDIDFAYRVMASLTVTPLDAPSMAGWSWYVFARNDPDEFLKICAKREDAKAKMAGTITNQRMLDDRRNQFAVIERIEKELTLDVEGIITELMEKFPEDVARVCRKHKEAWTEFFAAEPQ